MSNVQSILKTNIWDDKNKNENFTKMFQKTLKGNDLYLGNISETILIPGLYNKVNETISEKAVLPCCTENRVNTVYTMASHKWSTPEHKTRVSRRGVWCLTSLFTSLVGVVRYTCKSVTDVKCRDLSIERRNLRILGRSIDTC